MGPK
jgi:hypothetical protein